MGGEPRHRAQPASPSRSSSSAPEVLREILRGGADAVRRGGRGIVGGHSIDDPEPKYGLAVTGIVHPDAVLTNAGGRPGDALVLTKPLGGGAGLDRGQARAASPTTWTSGDRGDDDAQRPRRRRRARRRRARR